jgi:uncharacterized protein
MRLRLEEEIRLEVVDTQRSDGAEEDGLDPLLVDEGVVSPAGIVEDELILSLPIVAMHDADACPGIDGGAPNAGGDDEPTASPFAILAELKRGEDGG